MGRQMLDPMLIANELMEDFGYSKESWIFMLAFEKAYDMGTGTFSLRCSIVKALKLVGLDQSIPLIDKGVGDGFLKGVSIKGGSNEVSAVALEWGCTVGTSPLEYLGMPLGGNPKQPSFWPLVIDKIERRLDRWKSLALTRGRKIRLAKSGSQSLKGQTDVNHFYTVCN
ncbi:hypothetical protein SDJN02_21723, partial [Cucurbita argyrosperma subsp. argyrosperma]